MALKIAKFYKYIGITKTATGLKVALPAPADVVNAKVKCDNFATRIDIKWTDSASPFDFKYVSFDGNALFEIIDCIGNGGVYSFFIQYRTNMALDGTTFTDFTLTGTTPKNLSACHYSGQEAAEIFGDLFNTVYDIYTMQDAHIMWALKIRLSEIPQNFNRVIAGNGTWIEINNTERGTYGNRQYVPTPRNYNAVATDFDDFHGYDNAVTVILPIPIKGKTNKISITRAGTPYEFELYDDLFYPTLNALISDLTLSIDLIPLATGSLYSFEGHATAKAVQVIVTTNGATLRLEITEDRNYIFGDFLRSVSIKTGFYYPFFVCDVENDGGFAESYAYIQIPLNNYDQQIPLTLNLCGNVIDISRDYTRAIFIQQFNGMLRIWTNLAKNVYVDISTSVEFAKSAYSNYDAYVKANLNLTASQQRISLEQQQAQRREQLGFNMFRTGATTIAQTVTAAFTGNPVGAASAAVGGLADIVTAGISNDITAQNERANLDLRSAQAQEAARCTIVPGTQLTGSIKLSDFYTYADTNVAYMVTYVQIPINSTFQDIIVKETLDRRLIQKVNNADAISVEWTNGIYWIELTARFGQTRKSVIIYGKVVINE